MRAIPGVDAAPSARSSRSAARSCPARQSPRASGLLTDANEDGFHDAVCGASRPITFETLGMTLRGRDFTATDAARRRASLMINETLARSVTGPVRTPIGKRMKLPLRQPGPSRNGRRSAGRQVRLADGGAASLHVSAVVADAPRPA